MIKYGSRPFSSIVLPRERLFKRLDAISAPAVIWITGAPGSGKSALVASYLDCTDERQVWYRLDAAGADAGTFFLELGEALRVTAPQTKLPRYTAETRLSPLPFARRYFRALFAALGSPCTLVLDNMQEVPAASPLHSLIAAGLEQLPSLARAILISRECIPASYARLRASRSLVLFDEQALTLTADETARLAALLLEQPLPAQTAAQVHTLTQGWAAGAVLLLERLRGGARIKETAPLRGDDAFDYFGGEIFERLDGAAQACLFACALPSTITPRLAQRLCGGEHAAQILENLHRRNYFTVKQAQPPEYQFHALFRRFLQARAAAALSAQAWRDMRVHAAQLLEEEKARVGEALELYASTAEWAQVVRLILVSAPVLMEQGRALTLQEWLGRLPPPLLRGEPWLLYWCGVCQLFEQPAEARTLFELAHAAFSERNDTLGRILACAALIDAMLFEMGESRRLDPWISDLETALHAAPVFPAPQIEARVLCSLFSALMVRRPQHPAMPALAARLASIVRDLANINLRLRVKQNIAFHDIFRGDMTAAFVLLEASRDTLRRVAADAMAAIRQQAVETWYYMLDGRHVHCMAEFDKGLALARENGISIWTPQLYGNGLASAIAAGDAAKIERLRAEYSALSLDRHPIDAAYRHCTLAWCELARGDTTAALRHQGAGLALAHVIGMPFLESLAHLGMGHVLHAQDDRAGAREHVEKARHLAEEATLGILLFPCTLMAAQLAFARDDAQAGMAHLRNALQLGRAHGYTGAYWWRTEIMAELCYKALRAGIETLYVQDLARRRNLPAPAMAELDCTNWPWRLNIYTLGRCSLIIDDRPAHFGRKAKPLELLLALIALGGREVPVNRLTDVLWPDAGAPADIFKVTLGRLRREVLPDPALLTLRGNRLTLDDRRCWVDVWSCERRLHHLDTALKAGDVDCARRALEAALAFYRGPFLQDDDASWAIALRERLRQRVARGIAALNITLPIHPR